MDTSLKTILWQQFGGAIDMLENAIKACPENLWETTGFWHNSFHALFYLDYYLSDPDNFMPPAPFGLSEFDPSGALPERVYTQAELLDYAGFCRQKCHDLIAGLTAEGAARRFVNAYRDYSILEILIYNMRHVQHHAAQLNLMLRQGGAAVPNWVSRAEMAL